PLKDGDELAVIPPVSGGAVGQRRGIVTLRDVPLDPIAIGEGIRSDADGALVVFQGIVRSHSRGKQVRALVYEAYGSMAVKQMEQLADEARRRWPILDLAIVHRTGTLQVGEVSVVIAVAASHRGEAFDACEWLIDELKHTVPIWKKEVYTEGEAWIDDRPEPDRRFAVGTPVPVLRLTGAKPAQTAPTPELEERAYDRTIWSNR